MFDMSLGEMAVIAVLVLIFFDADQLPELMRKAGRIYGQVRSASDDLRRAFNTEVARVDADKRREELERRRQEVARIRAANRPTVAPDAAAEEVISRPDPAQAARSARSAGAAADAPMGSTSDEAVPAPRRAAGEDG